jgi:hypothetical protein
MACTQTEVKENSSALFRYSGDHKQRWSSPENLNGTPGQGGQENNGAKGHAFDPIPAGTSRELMNVEGQGIITRMWITIIDRSPEMLRSLKLEIFWDKSPTPAVAVPFGDFFGVGLGRTAAFENALFVNAEGRSFQCFIPMPYKSGARVVVTNESTKDLSHIFWDIDFQETERWDNDNLYFHANWNRDTATALAQDFELLPTVKGRGRFLGVNVGINANPVYLSSWWGEGEVKVFLDADTEYPTLVGTGTEDYIGTGWGQGQYANAYAGCLIADGDNRQWAFYRFHVPDPVFFANSCRVTLQQIGGDQKQKVLELQQAGAPLIPVSIDEGGKLWQLYEKGNTTQLNDRRLADGWTNFYRSDDMSATAYFYLDRPASELSSLQPVSYRTARLQ